MAKTVDDKKIIYSMNRVSRAYGTKVVLKDISISYYYGAKIGVIGENGAGKSSLFKILAGVDKDFTGETIISPGYTLGYLEQDPFLEAGKTVKEIVMEGVKPVTDLLAEFDKVIEAFGDPDADFDKLCARQAELQEKQAWLSAHDYIGTKIATGRATTKDYADEIATMTEYAARVDELRTLIAGSAG